MPAGHFTRVLLTKDVTPLEPRVLEYKLYAREGSGRRSSCRPPVAAAGARSSCASSRAAAKQSP